MENSRMLKSLELSWLLTKNVKESYYHISSDSFIKNNVTLGLKFLLCLNGKCFDIKETEIMDFQLQ